MNREFDVPILVITFNRPANTERVLKQVLSQNPTKLYIASDGPRPSNHKDEQDVLACRKIIQEMVAGCNAKLLLREMNLGCALGVVSAIDWVFAEEKKLIILEDDCVPSNDFFTFCKTLLERYELNQNVMHISGTRWNPEFEISSPYFFSTIGHIWGWATWKRAWEKFDLDMKQLKSYRKSLFPAKMPLLQRKYWTSLFRETSASNEKHTWDYSWQFTLFREKGLAVVPRENLISNIGQSGAHTSEELMSPSHTAAIFNLPTGNWTDENNAILPEPNFKYDNWHMRKHFLKNLSFKRKIGLLMKVQF